MRILREVNNYSQAYVASVLDIEQNTYSKLENGQIKLTVDRVKKLASLYKVSADYFLSDESPVLHYNKGNGSHSNSGLIEIYNSGNNISHKELYDRMLQTKDEQIELLKIELDKIRSEREQLLKLIDKITNRFQ